MNNEKLMYYDTVKLPKQFSGSQEDIDWIFHDILFEIKMRFYVIESDIVDDIMYTAIELDDGTKTVLITEIAIDELAHTVTYSISREGDHKAFYDCPESILYWLTPTANPSIQEWREKCRAKTKHNKLLLKIVNVALAD